MFNLSMAFFQLNPLKTLAALVFLALAAACSSDSNADESLQSASAGNGQGQKCLASSEPHLLDKNADGQVQMGVATPGPRDDGGYYQALVETAQSLSKAECFKDVIVVDNVGSAESESILGNLAEQGVDLIAVGGTDIAQSLPELVEEYSDILWYCNCGSDFPSIPGLIQSRDDSIEINYTAGQATALLLMRSDKNRVLFLGCCNLAFEQESFKAFEAGLQDMDSNFEITYIPTGAYPFDFNNTPAAVEALAAGIGSVDAVYPFLGDAHQPVIQRANEEGILTLSAGASNVCQRTDLKYDVAVRFDAGDYLETILSEIISGQLQRGEVRKFSVGVDPQVGAKICSPADEEAEFMEELYSAIAAGHLSQRFQEIKSEVYSGN